MLLRPGKTRSSPLAPESTSNLQSLAGGRSLNGRLSKMPLGPFPDKQPGDPELGNRRQSGPGARSSEDRDEPRRSRTLYVQHACSSSCAAEADEGTDERSRSTTDRSRLGVSQLRRRL